MTSSFAYIWLSVGCFLIGSYFNSVRLSLGLYMTITGIILLTQSLIQ